MPWGVVRRYLKCRILSTHLLEQVGCRQQSRGAGRDRSVGGGDWLLKTVGMLCSNCAVLDGSSFGFGFGLTLHVRAQWGVGC